MSSIPFQTIDWTSIEKIEYAGEAGSASWQTVQYNGLRIRVVEYSKGYMADHWCKKGHIVYCLEGAFVSELKNGERFHLNKGMSYVVSDELSSHRSLSGNGVKLLIIDGDFLKNEPDEKAETRLIDLSHTIENGLITYKGLPAPIICDYLSREESRQIYEQGTEFQIGKIEMVSNTGTYIDCPFHRFENGKDISEMGLERFADLDGIVIRVPFTDTLEITEDHLKNYQLDNRAVLIHTGWDSNWNTEKYYENHPYLTRAAAEYLRSRQVALVGIDSHNIDSTQGKSRPAHTILLAAEILIVEHLCNLNTLPEEAFTFTAIPPKVKGVGTFPVRAMAKVQNKIST